jgi:hypothetical protein
VNWSINGSIAVKIPIFIYKNSIMQIAEEVKISDNGFVFNSKTGDSFNLNPIGLEMIKMIEANIDFDKIKTAILEKYDIDDLTFEKDFYEFCALLKHHQITLLGDPLNFV